MSETRPFSDFLSHPSEIAEQVGRSGHPVILTESRFGDFVLMPRAAYEKYEDNKALNELYSTLEERAVQAEATKAWTSHEDVMRGARSMISKGYEQADV